MTMQEPSDSIPIWLERRLSLSDKKNISPRQAYSEIPLKNCPILEDFNMSPLILCRLIYNLDVKSLNCYDSSLMGSEYDTHSSAAVPRYTGRLSPTDFACLHDL